MSYFYDRTYCDTLFDLSASFDAGSLNASF